MYVRPTIQLGKILKKIWFVTLLVVVYCGLIYRLYDYRGLEALDIPMSISTVLGFAVSLLLGFRTGEAYDRWWEARKIWGAVVNDSRTFVRQLIGFLPYSDKQEVKEIAYLTIAWNYALKSSLRSIEVWEEIRHLLTDEDYELIKDHQNVPNGLIYLIERRIKRLKETEKVSLFEFVALDGTLKRFCDHMGKAERINNTVFPAHYRLFTRISILLYMIMLPFGMLKSTGWFMIPIVTIVFFFFSTLERIAYVLQDPFMNRGSDTPMLAICRTIEINIRQMLGETDLPEKISADKNGVMM